MKNEYYSNNKVLKRTSKNNIIPHIWVFFCKFWKIFILLLPYFTIFLYFHLFISKHFETYLCTIRIIFVFVFVFVVILKTNIIRIHIRLILKSEYYSYSYSFDFEKRILFVFVFGWFWKMNIIRIRIRSKIIIRLITDRVLIQRDYTLLAMDWDCLPEKYNTIASCKIRSKRRLQF